MAHRRSSSGWNITLNPEIKRGILAVLLFLIAILAALSFFGRAGMLGTFVDSFFSLFFGIAKYIMPLLLVVWAVLIEREDANGYRATHIIGVVLMTLSLSGLIHLFLADPDMVAAALRGEGGGLVGLVLSYPLMRAFDFWVSLIVLIILPLVALLFLFNTTLSAIAHFFYGVFRFFTAPFRFFGSAFQPSKVERVRVIGAFEGDEEAEAPAFQNKRLGDAAIKKQAMEDAEDEEEEADAEEEEDAEDEPVRLAPATAKTGTLRANPYSVVSTKGLPPISILTTNSSKPTAGDIKKNAQAIKDTLAQFGVDVELGDVRVGPTITQYAVKPMRGIKLSRITALSNDLALELAAHPIRIEAPIPGESYVGIEVPNQRIAMVTLKELFESDAFRTRDNNMMIALGKDVGGQVWFAELTKMPHMLVAGATGSGKTVCINSIILSLIYQNTPETLRFIFVDPKRVELTLYNGIPHLLTPVITDVKKTINALRWAISEMERRFDLLAAARKRDIGTYNADAKEKLPYIVFVIDELADLMTTSPKEVEAGIVRLAQMARAVGIHLILATQRPSVDVITGLIKANIPGRVAFSVASLVDSRTILDISGAEKLLGRGDMLFLSPSLGKPKRLQGAYISDNELKAVANYVKEDEPPQYDLSIAEKGPSSGGNGSTIFGGQDDDRDPLFDEARELVVREGKASASLLQRRLKLGYARAARVLDELEDASIIGPGDGAKPREILITAKELATMDAPDAPLSSIPTSDLHTPAVDTDDELSDDAFSDSEETEDEAFPSDDEPPYDNASKEATSA